MADRLFTTTFALLSMVLLSAAAHAQERVPVSVEGRGGYAVFADAGSGDHKTFGTGVRWVVAPRVAGGPEFVYLIGPGRDRDLFLMGAVSADLLRERRVTPFVIGAAGLMSHSDAFNSWSEFAFSFGPGARLRISERLSAGFEWRLGWPLHSRLELTAGYEF